MAGGATYCRYCRRGPLYRERSPRRRITSSRTSVACSKDRGLLGGWLVIPSAGETAPPSTASATRKDKDLMASRLAREPFTAIVRAVPLGAISRTTETLVNRCAQCEHSRQGLSGGLPSKRRKPGKRARFPLGSRAVAALKKSPPCKGNSPAAAIEAHTPTKSHAREAPIRISAET